MQPSTKISGRLRIAVVVVTAVALLFHLEVSNGGVSQWNDQAIGKR